MEKTSLKEFHAAMYAKYPGISWETAEALYRIYYNIPEVNTQPEEQPQPKKKSKKK